MSGWKFYVQQFHWFYKSKCRKLETLYVSDSQFCTGKKKAVLDHVLRRWTFWGSSYRLMRTFLKWKVWSHSHLPAFNIPEYSTWGHLCTEAMFPLPDSRYMTNSYSYHVFLSLPPIWSFRQYPYCLQPHLDAPCCQSIHSNTLSETSPYKTTTALPLSLFFTLKY